MHHRVAHNDESAPCTNTQESPVTPGKKVSRKAPPVTVSPTASPSVRTLILGIDRTGHIVQHDRTAPKILARSGDDLIGVHLTDITATAAKDGGPPVFPDKASILAVASLLEAIKSDREANDMLSIALADGTVASSVVTARPMSAGGSDVAAFVILQIPIPSGERFIEPALMREVLLRDSSLSDEDTLDFSDLAKKMTAQLVPAFCTAAEVLVLEKLVGDNEMPSLFLEPDAPLRRLHVKHDRENPAWQAAFPVGEILRYPEGSPYTRCLETGEPVLEQALTSDSAKKLARAWRRKPVSGLLSETSMLLLPAISKGAVVGLFCCFREAGTRRFDRYDMEMAMEFAARQAVFFDHATRYNREHATALTLQRAMLPTGLTYPSSIEVRHRYLPGSELVEVGGDWYESIKLPGARVALVVGDVAGHGVRAAVTMGRLRTAIQTLAMLELPPAESLQQLDELMQTIGEREPHFATCAYAVYDAVTGEIELAVAGHLPPLLVRPDGTNSYLEVAPSPPLGIIGDGIVETSRVQVEDGSLFVLYTDGLVESRDRDISEGLDRLQSAFGEGAPDRDLEDLCKTALDGVYSDAKRDDIAVLIAKLRRIPEDHRVEFPLEPDLSSVRQARAIIRDPLKRWGLEDLIPATELLVSELVTNAFKYAKGETLLRLILEPEALTCEVHDCSPALPRVLQVDRDAESGRGLHVVSQLANRWGARRTPNGKVVWCSQLVPEELGAAMRAAMGITEPVSHH
jgi:serine phosphatase RsbU (regulator of sigma subunit)/anti-sigma regulatory factor (Ser/Thr protein kinase)